MAVAVRDIGQWPTIQLFPSQGCNLDCTYCTNVKRFDLGLPDKNFIADPVLRETVVKAGPTHWYLSGGEPLLCPGIEDFVAELGARGHVVSFDTNLILAPRRLAELFGRWGREAIGFVNISHHVEQGVTADALIKRAVILRELDVPCFVKSIALPEHLAAIGANVARFKAAGLGTAVSILSGPWGGRWFPQEYTREEGWALLDLVTLNSHGLQLFSGIHSRGLPCRSGKDYLCWNMFDEGEVLPCCHGAEQPVALANTYVETGNRDPVPCQVSQCQGDLMFIYGINGVWDESERFHALCHGPVEPLGRERVLAAIEQLGARGLRLVDERMFDVIRGRADETMTPGRSGRRLPVIAASGGP